MNQILEYDSLRNVASKKVIIYGCWKNAVQFAMRLLNQDIFFDMFLFPDVQEKYRLPFLLNKSVINIQKCLKLDDFIIAVPYTDKEEAETTLQKYGLGKYIMLEKIASNILNSPNIVLYGTGSRAEHFWQNYGHYITINYVCDSEDKKSGSFWHGKEIVSPVYFSNTVRDTVVIIASTFVDEICDILNEYEVKKEKIFWDDGYDGLKFGTRRGKILKVSKKMLCDSLRDMKNQYNVLYGEANIVDEVTRKFGYLGVSFSSIIRRESIQEDGTVYNLAYENNNAMFVVADECDKEIYNGFLAMGVPEQRMIWLGEFANRWRGDHREVVSALDPNIGHAYISSKDEYPGFMQYQYFDGKRKPIKIVALGGSTTMSYRVKNISWSEYLSRILKENEIPHIIYCGGIDGYTASSELLKLVRDAIWLEPNIVISYSGTNNMCAPSVRKNLFVEYYQEELFEKITNLSMKNMYYVVNYGVKPKVSSFIFFYKQLEMMHSICVGEGIVYKAFLQPVLQNKRKYFEEDGEVAILSNWLFDSSKGEYVLCNDNLEDCDYDIDQAKDFMRCAEEKSDSWFCNLSSLFDNVGGVYMDACHVYDKGNYLVAKKIFDELKEILFNVSGKNK